MIAEALILGGKDQEDHYQREDESVDKRVAFLHELPAFALEVVGEAFGKALGLLLEEFDRLAHRPAWERHGRERRRIELLEIGERVRRDHLAYWRHAPHGGGGVG